MQFQARVGNWIRRAPWRPGQFFVQVEQAVRPGGAEMSADDRLIQLFNAFQPYGGLATADAVATQLVFSSAIGAGRLATLAATREVISIGWAGKLWLPVFQFERSGAIPSPALKVILQEMMAVVYDEWEVAEWFSTPNAWLENIAPAAVLHSDERAVLNAARADCFAAMGD
jgi:hypothetical protein